MFSSLRAAKRRSPCRPGRNRKQTIVDEAVYTFCLAAVNRILEARARLRGAAESYTLAPCPVHEAPAFVRGTPCPAPPRRLLEGAPRGRCGRKAERPARHDRHAAHRSP